MSTDLSALDKFRTGAEVQSEEKGIASIVPISGRSIMAFDQSISNTGWALLHGKDVIYTGNIKTGQMGKGHEDTLLRGEKLISEYLYLIRAQHPHLIVHEYPPVALPRMARPESSLVSAMALRAAARIESVSVTMVSAQTAKKRLTGNGNAKKGLVKEAVLLMDPKVRSLKPLNEAVIDAIALGWVACEREGETDGS